MKDNTGQYFFKVWENGRLIEDRVFDDPFIHSVFEIQGWRAAWDVLRGRFKLVVGVDGTKEATNVVFAGDYTKIEGPPQTVSANNGASECF